MTRRTAVGLIALALALPLPAFAQAGGHLRTQIAKVGQAWERAYNAGDAAAVAALYTKDAKLMVRHRIAPVGRSHPTNPTQQ